MGSFLFFFSHTLLFSLIFFFPMGGFPQHHTKLMVESGQSFRVSSFTCKDVSPQGSHHFLGAGKTTMYEGSGGGGGASALDTDCKKVNRS